LLSRRLAQRVLQAGERKLGDGSDVGIGKPAFQSQHCRDSLQVLVTPVWLDAGGSIHHGAQLKASQCQGHPGEIPRLRHVAKTAIDSEIVPAAADSSAETEMQGISASVGGRGQLNSGLMPACVLVGVASAVDHVAVKKARFVVFKGEIVTKKAALLLFIIKDRPRRSAI
jgi:hypothetical protein